MVGKWGDRLSHLAAFISGKIKARIEYIQGLKVVSLSPNQESKGNVLLSYRIEPFRHPLEAPLPNDHTWHWECRQIAKTFLGLGYSVDVIQFHNESFVPTKPYAVFIDIRYRLQTLSPLLNSDCVKVLHVDIANMTFRNTAEYRRLLDLQQRRGVTLCPQRYEVPNQGIEYADCATVLGNDFTVGTFEYARKPMFRIPISTPVEYPSPAEKNFESVRNRFVWFGSGGLVLKGLDLALEAFAEMPECHLTVCGPVNKEPEFERAYQRELYQTPNILTHGWIGVDSPEFLALTQQNLGLVYPSACEGQSGGVVTCMHAGLVPITSYETGVDVHDFGVIFSDCSVETIKATVRRVAQLPSEELRQLSLRAWEFARANHTREKFAQVYRDIAKQLLEMHRQKQQTVLHLRQPVGSVR
jgi:glycosyltransferase involved in cell wall biosynthesis